MFSINYFGIENPANYAHSKAALDIILEEIEKSEFAGRVIWDYDPDPDAEEERLEDEADRAVNDPNWAKSYGSDFGGPFYGKFFYILDADGEIEEHFSIFMDDVESLYTQNEAWYNLAKASLDRIDPIHTELYDSSIYLKKD